MSSPARPVRRYWPVRVAAAAVAGSVLVAGAFFAAAHWKGPGSHPAALNQADVLGLPGSSHRAPAAQRGAPQPAQVSQPEIIGTAVVSRAGRHRHAGDRVVAVSGYRNPLRAVTGLVPERIDEGVDFAGTGPVYALGDAVISSAGYNAGWPGGGWITYRLIDGPAAGLMVYLAEDVTPVVHAGQRVSSSTVIATMFNGGFGIETGWAQPTGASAESELPEAGGIGGYGPFPTMVGVNFDELLQSLGVPPAPNAGQPAYGILPAAYPTGWR